MSNGLVDELLSKISDEDLETLSIAVFIYSLNESLNRKNKENIDEIKSILDRYGVTYVDDVSV